MTKRYLPEREGEPPAATGLLDLLGPARSPQSLCITCGDLAMPRGEVWGQAADLARDIERPGARRPSDR
ncbi:MAG: hypothetical protein ABI662_01520, partial [Dermatophilaceae bacterium]